MTQKLIITHEELLGGLAIHAQRLVAAAGNFAAGQGFPDPHLMAKEIDRMAEINNALLAMAQKTANDQAA